MLATHGPARPSSAVILENWSRWADAAVGRASVPQASARTRATRRMARAWTLIVPEADMTARGWRRAREGPAPAVVARWVPEGGAPFVQYRYKRGTRITIESARGYAGGNRGADCHAPRVLGLRLSVHGSVHRARRGRALASARPRPSRSHAAQNFSGRSRP